LIFVIAVNYNTAAQKSISIILSNPNEVCKKCNKLLPKKILDNEIDSISKTYTNCILNKGYLSASFDSTKTTKDTIFFYLFNGIKYYWGEINFIDDPNGDMKNMVLKNNRIKGKPVIIETIIKLKNKILTNYENNGYPFASIKADSFEISTGLLSIKYYIKSGTFITFDSLETIGNAKISNNFLKHYLGILSGKNYNEKKVIQINRLLKELTFISIEKPEEIFFIGNTACIRLFLKQKKANQFNGVLGIMPNTKIPGKFLVTGDISLNLINSFHRNDHIEFSWKKLETSSQNLFASIQLPYILNKPVGGIASIKLFKKDSTFLNVTSHIGIPFYLTGSNNIGLYYENCSSTLLSISGLSSTNTLPELSSYNSNIFGISLNYSSLNNKNNPINGYAVKFQAGYGKKTIEKHPEINPLAYNEIQMNSFRNEFFSDISKYTNIYKKWVVKLRVQSGYINTKKLFKNELYRIGGLYTLRGFDEESIYASEYLIGSSEIRFLFEENSAFFAFYDQGYYKNIDTKYDNPAGFGAGIEFQTKAGIFTLSYALGRQLGNSVQFKTARVHFGFINRF
jgi:outer membrane protein assembly factor BamA